MNWPNGQSYEECPLDPEATEFLKKTLMAQFSRTGLSASEFEKWLSSMQPCGDPNFVWLTERK
jgi:hypothetical protein